MSEITELIKRQAASINKLKENLSDENFRDLPGAKNDWANLLGAVRKLAELFNLESKLPEALSTTVELVAVANVFNQFCNLPEPTNAEKVKTLITALKSIPKILRSVNTARSESNENLKLNFVPSVKVSEIEAIAIGVYPLFLNGERKGRFESDQASATDLGLDLISRAKKYCNKTAIALCLQSQEEVLLKTDLLKKVITSIPKVNVTKGPAGWNLFVRNSVFQGISPDKILVVEGVRIGAACAAASNGFRVVFVTGGMDIFNNKPPQGSVGDFRLASLLPNDKPGSFSIVNSPSDIIFETV